MLQSIIEKFSDKHGFVLDFDKVIQYLQSEEHFTQKQINKFLLMLVQHNLKIIKNISDEIDIQKKINEMSGIISFETNLSKITSVPTKVKKVEKFTESIDVSFYTRAISELLNQGLDYDKLKHVLPKYESSEFFNIINTILFHYIKQIEELKKLMKKTMDKDMIKYISEEKEKLEYLKNIIINYRDSFANIDEEKFDDSMNIVFDPNTYENDLSNLLNEHYQDFYILLDSMSKNVLKGVKTFTPIGGNKSTSEVRYNNARILFEKIDNNTYFVYYIFLKKDVDKYYHETLVNRINSYAANKKELLHDFYDENTKEQFIAVNKEIYEQVMDMLNTKGTKGGSEYAKRIK